MRYKSIHITTDAGTRFVFPGFKVIRNPQGWWKSIIGNTAEDDFQQYPEGASTPEDIRDIADEAPVDEADQGSDGTQNSEEQLEGTLPEDTVDEPAVSSAATGEAEKP